MRPRHLFVALVIPFAACSQAPAVRSPQVGREAAVQQVAVQYIAFQPSTIAVRVGTTITWVNRDDQVRHTVTSGVAGDKGVPGVNKGRPNEPDGVFVGELDDAGSTFVTTFDAPGTYEYFCEVHPVMTGSVVVS